MRNMPRDFFNENVYKIEQQFQHNDFTTATATLDGWTPVFGAGTIAVADRAITIEEPATCVFTDTAVDNQFMSLWTTIEAFKFHGFQPMHFRVDFPVGTADEDLDQQSSYIGCFEGADGINDLLDLGAGPVLDRDKFGFYKCGATGAAVFTPNTWVCFSSFGALQQTTELLAANQNNLSGVVQQQHTAAIIRNAQRLEAEWMPTNVVPGVGGVAPTILEAEVSFWINGVLVAKHLQRGAFAITAATAEAMNFGYVSRMQLGEAAVNHISYMGCAQLRR